MPDDPATELQFAYDALTDADALRQQGTERGTVSRLYYACYHAAKAVLYDRGYDPQTHGGVVRLFGREVVQAGDASGSDGSFLNNMLKYRNHADYKQKPVTPDINTLYSRTERFVDDMAEVLDDDDS